MEVAGWCGDTKVVPVWQGGSSHQAYEADLQGVCKGQLEAMVCLLPGFNPAWAEWHQPSNPSSQSQSDGGSHQYPVPETCQPQEVAPASGTETGGRPSHRAWWKTLDAI